MIRPLPAAALSQLSAQAYVDLRCPGLPLAVYREICAHLRQCADVRADILAQSATAFDYSQSQAGGLRLSSTSNMDGVWQQVEAILQHYGARYGPWELVDS